MLLSVDNAQVVLLDNVSKNGTLSNRLLSFRVLCQCVHRLAVTSDEHPFSRIHALIHSCLWRQHWLSLSLVSLGCTDCTKCTQILTKRERDDTRLVKQALNNELQKFVLSLEPAALINARRHPLDVLPSSCDEHLS